MATKERPMICQGWGVQAILDGRKTQTRRIIKFEASPAWEIDCLTQNAVYFRLIDRPDIASIRVNCPHGEVGDRLWVRETWCVGVEWDDEKPSDIDPLCGGNDIWYLADGEKTEGYGKARPSIFMPRWATRLQLEITGIRVERVQDIGVQDAGKEGVVRPETTICDLTVDMFERLWDSINSKRGYGWDKNPWVWVIEFRRI